VIKTVGVSEDPKIQYSQISDVLYFLFDKEASIGNRTEEATPGINLDYDETGKLIGVEVLNASLVLKEFIRKSHSAITMK